MSDPASVCPFQVRPSLIIELGTMCGGSAVFLARTAMGYNEKAKVLTFDIQPEYWRTRQYRAFARRNSASGVVGLESEHWRELTKSGNIEAIRGDITSPADGNAYQTAVKVAQAAANEGVLIIDDASHHAAMVQRGFERLQHLVTPGSYYIVEASAWPKPPAAATPQICTHLVVTLRLASPSRQDTRLDFDCAYQVLTSKAPWSMCVAMLGTGGPALGVRRLQLNSSAYWASFVQDRSAEGWGVTQHPGGYLRRRGAVLWASPPPPPPEATRIHANISMEMFQARLNRWKVDGRPGSRAVSV